MSKQNKNTTYNTMNSTCHTLWHQLYEGSKNHIPELTVLLTLGTVPQYCKKNYYYLQLSKISLYSCTQLSDSDTKNNKIIRRGNTHSLLECKHRRVRGEGKVLLGMPNEIKVEHE